MVRLPLPLLHDCRNHEGPDSCRAPWNDKRLSVGVTHHPTAVTSVPTVAAYGEDGWTAEGAAQGQHVLFRTLLICLRPYSGFTTSEKSELDLADETFSGSSHWAPDLLSIFG